MQTNQQRKSLQTSPHLVVVSRLWLVCCFLMACLVAPAWSETRICEGVKISVGSEQSRYAGIACKTVKQAKTLFNKCALPQFPNILTLEIVNGLPSGCVGQYHCGEGWIKVLAPPGMEAQRNPESAFYFLSAEDYFQSVIVHELAHSLFENARCPFAACIVANEYLAYAMQVMSLTAEQQAQFAENSGIDSRISRDELSVAIYMFAPNKFAQKAWAHLNQREDPCQYLGQILDGTILLDRERF